VKIKLQDTVHIHALKFIVTLYQTHPTVHK